MSGIKNPLELYKHLNQSNCRECMLPSCMAFSVAVIQGQKKITDCPYVNKEVIADLLDEVETRSPQVNDQQQTLNRLRSKMSGVDLAEAAQRLDVPHAGGSIVINCLGKDFTVNTAGDMVSVCHNNAWVHGPVLDLIIHGKGRRPVDNWVAFGELTGAGDWKQFFCHRCELEMKKLADAHTDVFFEILNLFEAKDRQGITNADRSVCIYPLPNVPFLINYWEPEEGFESKLNILFDSTTSDNISMESLYVLGRGLVEMFRALIVRHSKDGKLF